MLVLVDRLVDIPGRGMVPCLVYAEMPTDSRSVLVKKYQSSQQIVAVNFGNHIGSRRAISHQDPWGDDFMERHSKRGARYGMGGNPDCWKRHRGTQWRYPKVSFRIMASYFAEIDAVIHGSTA